MCSYRTAGPLPEDEDKPPYDHKQVVTGEIVNDYEKGADSCKSGDESTPTDAKKKKEPNPGKESVEEFLRLLKEQQNIAKSFQYFYSPKPEIASHGRSWLMANKL